MKKAAASHDGAAISVCIENRGWISERNSGYHCESLAKYTEPGPGPSEGGTLMMLGGFRRVEPERCPTFPGDEAG